MVWVFDWAMVARLLAARAPFRLSSLTYTEWRQQYVAFPVALMSGESCQGWVWRRRVRGQWEYRALSEEELTQVYYDKQW